MLNVQILKFMGEIYNLIPLIKLYLICNLILMFLMFLVLILYVVKLVIDKKQKSGTKKLKNL